MSIFYYSSQSGSTIHAISGCSMFVAVGGNGSTVPSITVSDNYHNNWQLLASRTGGITNLWLAVYWVPSVVAGVANWTPINVSASTGTIFGGGAFTGVGGIDAIDTVNNGLAPSEANELGLSFAIAVTASDSLTPGSGFIELEAGSVGSGNNPAVSEYQIQTTPTLSYFPFTTNSQLVKICAFLKEYVAPVVATPHFLSLMGVGS